METSESIKKWHEKILLGYKTKKIKPSFLGKHHTNDTKEKMRKSALKSTHQRKCKKTIQYSCVDGNIVHLDSSYEKKLAVILDENGIKWIRPKPLKWNDKTGLEHNYFPDFYLVDYNIYLDPKNEYCFQVQKEKIDILKRLYTNCFFLHKNEICIEFI